MFVGALSSEVSALAYRAVPATIENHVTLVTWLHQISTAQPGIYSLELRRSLLNLDILEQYVHCLTSSQIPPTSCKFLVRLVPLNYRNLRQVCQLNSLFFFRSLRRSRYVSCSTFDATSTFHICCTILLDYIDPSSQYQLSDTMISRPWAPERHSDRTK